ncbi:MAG: hypothetical protein AB7E37_00550 [Candidatus Altimarinota bacterium]
MKVFTIFITLIIYFFSFISHNSVMALSSNQDLSNHNIVNHSFHTDSHSKKSSMPICSLIVDFDQDIKHSSENILKNFIIKITLDFTHIAFYAPLDKDILYLKINSPPYLNKDIKNYSYVELIKIIKSNT